jgi:hypothetical protein
MDGRLFRRCEDDERRSRDRDDAVESSAYLTTNACAWFGGGNRPRLECLPFSHIAADAGAEIRHR